MKKNGCIEDVCVFAVLVVVLVCMALGWTVEALLLVVGICGYGMLVRTLNMRRLRREATRRAREEVENVGDVWGKP